jgi:hypothetical protein
MCPALSMIKEKINDPGTELTILFCRISPYGYIRFPSQFLDDGVKRFMLYPDKVTCA